MSEKPLYTVLAHLVQARQNCINSGNAEWLAKHEERIVALVKEHMPSGSGIDSGVDIELDECTENKIVFYTSFHHMNDGGMYDGWTEHRITLLPSLVFGYELKITGPNRNDIKEHLHEEFSHALSTLVEQYKQEG